MKMNMTATEALECVEKVKERKMGYLFENMEKIDIQAERRAAENAKKDAQNARKDAEDAKKDAEDAKKTLADFLENREAEQAAMEAKHQANIVTMCRQLGGTKEIAISNLQEAYGLSNEEATEKVSLYWKEPFAE